MNVAIAPAIGSGSGSGLGSADMFDSVLTVQENVLLVSIETLGEAYRLTAGAYECAVSGAT